MAAEKYVMLRAGIAAFTAAAVVGGTAFFSLDQQATTSTTPSPAPSTAASGAAPAAATTGSVQSTPTPTSAPARRSRAS